MWVIEDAWHRDELPRPIVATIGNFDGLHRGQQAILQRVRDESRKQGVDAVVVTFEPHPLTVLRPARALERITPAEQKRALLERMGMDGIVEIRFTADFASVSAREFVEDFLCKKLAVKALFVGSHFAFGRDREGDIELLLQLASQHRFTVEGIEELLEGDEVVSSTRIRQAVRDGEMVLASRMLGRCFSVPGRVVQGEGRGHRLGWPTINVETEERLLPKDGVYAGRAWLAERDVKLEGVINIGSRPTFSDLGDRIVEAHLFDFHGDIYGSKVELSFERWLRGERRFTSAEELTDQIARDAGAAREYLATSDCSLFVPTLSG